LSENNLESAYSHLSRDKVMSFLIDTFKDKIDWSNRYSPNYPLSIANLIIEQQISFKAAITVKKRFKKLVKDCTNEEIIMMPDEKLQSTGISFRKAEYIKNVFEFFSNNKPEFEKMEDQEVISLLSSIKGVGEWTAQMFLIFNLFRIDIFSPKDLALINSVKRNYFLSNVKKEDLDKLTEKWKPFNSIACLLLWESVENQIFFVKDN